jgi:hypothetical protein
VSTQPADQTPIPAKAWFAAGGAGVFTALLLHILTAIWPHSVEAGAVITGLFVLSFSYGRNWAQK